MTRSPAHQFDDLDEELAFQAGFRDYCKRERDREFLRELSEAELSQDGEQPC